MRAVVLAGGQGSRMAPYTKILPKPLLPVGDRPILDVILRQLTASGYTEVTLAIGHLGKLLQSYVGDGGQYGLRITYSHESVPMGTVGALTLIEGLHDTFLVMNGDVLTTPFYGPMLHYHRQAGAIATIAMKYQEVNVDFGVLTLDGSIGPLRRIQGIEEKPQLTYPVSIGVYVFEPRVLEYLQTGEARDFPELVTDLLAAGETVAAYEHDGYWADVGQFASLEEATRRYEERAEDFVDQGLPLGISHEGVAGKA
jgi:NDP-sugar pyrophosphorylase family protein